MSNVNYCSCNDIYTRKRNHHGVVCTRCNPQNIESLLVPNEIKAYKTWNFDFETGFSDNRMVRQQAWSDFNILPPPNISKLDDNDFVKPWTNSAYCIYGNHKAPDPYCSCGFYSVKEFGILGRGLSGGPFSHNSTSSLISNFDRNVLSVLNTLSVKEQTQYAKMFFYSPLMKTLELSNFQIVSEVALSGNVVECEKGYRSEKIKAKKLFILLDFFELNTISTRLGNYISRDRAESIYSTLNWLDFLNNYLKSMSNFHGCSFEMLVNVDKGNPIDTDLFNHEDMNGKYLSFEQDLYINERLKGIAESVVISNRLLKKQPFPDLEEMILGNSEDSDFNANIHQKNLKKIRNIDFKTLQRASERASRYSSYTGSYEISHIRQYQEKILAFMNLYKCITSGKTYPFSLSFPDTPEIFGFDTKIFFQNYERIQGLHPGVWFPNFYKNFKNTVDEDKQTEHFKDINNVMEHLNDLFKKKG